MKSWVRLFCVLAAVMAMAVAVSAPLVATRSARADDPDDAPVSIECEVTTDELATTGFFTLHFVFRASEELDRPLALAIELATGERELISFLYSPAPPTTKWKVGEAVAIDITAPYPAELLGTDVTEIDVLVGFHDSQSGRILPPRGAMFGHRGRGVVARMSAPVFAPVTEEAKIADILHAADELAKASRKPDAWSALEFGLRGAVSDPVKFRFRDAMAKLGDFPPRGLSSVEEQVVKARIADERERYLRQISGRLWDQGKLHGALRILETIGGKLSEAADSAVVGALSSANRAEKDIADLKEKILERVTPEEKEEADAAIRTLGRTKALLEKVAEWTKAGRFAPARTVLKDLTFDSPKAVRDQATDELKAVTKAWLAATPPDERTLADQALNHPAFARTTVTASHEFIFIGPKAVVESIPAPSRLQFDIAYVFLTDLFGRRPNPSGDRVTVYFKELWEFGGGVGGGKIIDIGSVKPDAVGTRVDTGLLFHELTHCIDDTAPVHAGFHEGLADFGAAYTHEILGRTTDAQAAFATAQFAFRKDYVERDLEYFRIPNYGPSAGFFLHFVEKYAKLPTGHDWKGYRQFFREYRRAPVKDGREPCVARSVGHYLMRAFGPGVLDDLIAFRFPLVEEDRIAVAREIELFDDGDGAVSGADGDLGVFPNTPLRRDLIQRRAIEQHRSGANAEDVRRICQEELGVIYDWRVIGPFEPVGCDAFAQVFPPERTIDFAQEFAQRLNTARWRTLDFANPARPVQIDALGWVLIEYSYMDDTATYALSHVTVDADTDAFVYVQADDDVVLFADSERIDGFVNRGRNDSTQLWWRGPVAHAPDAIRFRVHLKKGRTPLLLKIKNRRGPAGFVAAVAQLDGRPIPNLKVDIDPPVPPPAVAPPKWKDAVRLDFKTKAALSKLDFAVGGLEIANKLASSTGTGKGVGWRKYTVRPGFPKDSPSNLFWLKAASTEDADNFRLTIRLAPKPEAPKLAVTFQGEGGGDGLSGWNLLLWNSGGKVAGQLERYEDLWYQWTPRERYPEGGGESKTKERAPPEFDELVLTLVRARLTVTMNGQPLLTEVPIREIPKRHRIGISTWGGDPKFQSIELETAK